MSLTPAKIADVNSFWHYWGKARPLEESAAALHPLLYQCLDVAAISACRWNGTDRRRRNLAHALGVAEQARTASVLLSRIRWAEAQS
ncbi:MAG: HD domain-containing protein [Rubrivivax sp.]